MQLINSLTLTAIFLLNVPMSVHSNSAGGCKLIGSEDPAFNVRIGEKTAASLSAKELTAIRHNSVLLSNDTTKIVVAYVIRWTFMGTSGAVQTLDSMYAEPLILSTHQVGDTGIAPGAARVIHPNFNVSTEEFARSVDNPRLAELALATIPYGDIMSADLDGVVYDDGTFYGPDKSNYFLKFKTGLNARHDAGVGVLTLLKEGKTDTDVVADLERQVSERSQYGGATAHDYYYYQRSVEAEQLLRVYKQFGHDALVKNATLQRMEPRHNLVKASSSQER